MRKKHALVIGGTKGIGRALAKLLASENQNVSVVSRQLPPEVRRSLPSVRFWEADLLDDHRLFQTLDHIVQERGRLNYAIFLQRFRGEGDEWTGEIDTSLTATKKVIEYLAGRFDPLEAAIVLVGSVRSDFVDTSAPLSYHVAKAGFVQMARYYALLLGQKRIRVNCVSPGTTIKEESKSRFLNNKRLQQFYRKLIPLRRMGTAEDVAHVIAFLCSPGASFVTGQNIIIDGGVTIQWQEAVAERFGSSREIYGLKKI